MSRVCQVMRMIDKLGLGTVLAQLRARGEHV
jgi:hypothetical protein